MPTSEPRRLRTRTDASAYSAIRSSCSSGSSTVVRDLPPGPIHGDYWSGCDENSTRTEPALRPPPAELGADDEHERDEEHDDGDGDHLRELAREPQRRVEVDRKRLPRPDDERCDGVLVERRRERDEERR